MPITNGILRQQDIIPTLSSLPSRRRNAHMSLPQPNIKTQEQPEKRIGPTHHIPRQHNLPLPHPLQHLLQLRPRKPTRMLLPHHDLPVPRPHRAHLLRQRRPRREHRRSRRHIVHNVHDAAARAPVLVEQARDRTAGRGDVLGAQRARRVLVLGVDDEQRGVGGAGGGCWDAHEGAEGGCHCRFCGVVDLGFGEGRGWFFLYGSRYRGQLAAVWKIYCSADIELPVFGKCQLTSIPKSGDAEPQRGTKANRSRRSFSLPCLLMITHWREV